MSIPDTGAHPSLPRREQASKIIANLPGYQVDVVERIANMDRALPGYQDSRGGPGEENRILLIRETMEVGRSQLHSGRDEPYGPQHERDIFDELNMKNPQLAEDVRKLICLYSRTSPIWTLCRTAVPA